jgi:excisionase family DNA binding protein
VSACSPRPIASTQPGSAAGHDAAQGHDAALTAALGPLVDVLVERIASRVGEHVALGAAPSCSSPWLSVEEAAEHLRCKPKRLYDLVSQQRVPVHRDGSRLLFHRDELDGYLRAADTSLTPAADLALASRSRDGSRTRIPGVRRA